MARSLPTSRPSAGGSGWSVTLAPEILLEVIGAAHEIGAGFMQGPLDDHRVEPGNVRGRPDVEQLAGHEGDAVGVLRRHAADLARRAPPPGFLRQECLLPQHVGKAVPGLVGEAVVGALRLERRLLVLGEAMGGEARVAGGDVPGLEAELHEPPRGVDEMRGPIEPSAVERMRRDALGQPRRHRAAEAVQGLEGGNAGGLARLRQRRRLFRSGVEPGARYEPVRPCPIQFQAALRRVPLPESRASFMTAL